jgi:hypothetical protein
LIDVIGYNKHHLNKDEREFRNFSTTKTLVPGTGRSEAQQRGPNMQGHSSTRLSQQEQAKNKEVMLDLGETLMYMKPMVEGFALKNKLWCE